jgi:Tfp pilus assembly PilM family ATPase
MAITAPENIVGISIRDTILRMTEAVRSGGDWKITSVQQGNVSMPWRTATIKEMSLARRLAEDINSLHEKANFQAKMAVFTLDSSMVFIKKIPVDPNLNGPRLREHVHWEVEQFAVSPAEDYVVAFEHQQASKGAGFANAVVVFVRKTVTDFLKNVFLDTHLQLKAIDVDVFAAHRVVALDQNLEESARTALVDVRKENIQFSILDGKNFFLSQEIDYPVEEEGELLRREEDHLARIISKELRRIILDNKLGKGVEDFSTVLIYGDGLSSTVIEALRAMHNTRIDLANPFRRLKINGQAAAPEVQTHPEAFVVSVGAAIKGI